MMINPDLIAPCGLYCGVCAIYIAHRGNMELFQSHTGKWGGPNRT
jgi:hypothetical protein